MKLKRLSAILLSGALLTSSLFVTRSTAAALSTDEEEIVYELADYINIQYNSPIEKLATMKLQAEAGDYQLWALEETGEIALVTKGKDGAPDQILFSNPYDVAHMQKVDEPKQRVMSQIILKYSDGTKEVNMNSYVEAAKNRQIKLEKIRGGIRFNYTMGREQARILVPEQIEKTRFEEEILNKMPQNGDDGKQFVDPVINKNPYKYMKAFFSLKDPDAVSEAMRDDMLKTFPITEKYAIYILGKDSTVRDKKQLEYLITTYTDYTFDDLDADHQKVEFEATIDKLPLFKVAIEYFLDENGLIVTVPASDIRYDSSTFSLSSITILPYFGAGANDETGFTLVNDGSGSIVKYEDVKDSTAELTITGKVYGQDYSFHQIGGENQEVMRLPAFGNVSNVEYYDFDTEAYMAAVNSEDESIRIIPYDDIEANKEFIKKNKGKTPAAKEEAKTEESKTEGAAATDTATEGAAATDAANAETATDAPNAEAADGTQQPEQQIDPVTGAVIIHPRDSEKIAQSGKFVKFDDEKIKQSIGFIAYIEEGESLAEITTAHGGTVHDYNSTYATFCPRPSDAYELEGLSATGTTTLPIKSKRKYTGNFTIRYIPVQPENPGETINIADLATTLRNYLIAKGDLTKINDTNKDIPLYLETFGSIKTTQRFAGIPFEVQTPLTTFADAKSMIEELTGKKKVDGKTYKTTNNIVIKYTGWYNGGLYKTVPSKLKVEKEISKDMTLAELTKYANGVGAKIYPDVEFTYVNKVGFGDGFNYKDDAVQTIDGRTAVHKIYSALFQMFEPDGQLILSPLAKEKYYNNISGDFKKLGASGISVATLGSDLSSDHNEDYAFTREDAKEATTELFAAMKKDNKSILVDGGNAYSLKYADHILNVPLNSSENVFASEAVPFVGMVLHGYKNFAGTAINLDGDYDKSVLKAIENGASPYFILSYQHNNTSELKSFVDFSKYYSIRYNIWLDELTNTYTTLNSILSSVKFETISKHETVDKRIVRVTYSNGEQFVLNYNIDDYTYMHSEEDSYVIPKMGAIKFNADGTTQAVIKVMDEATGASSYSVNEVQAIKSSTQEEVEVIEEDEQ